MPYRSSIHSEPPCAHNTKAVIGSTIGLLVVALVGGYVMGYFSWRDAGREDLVRLRTENQRLTRTLAAQPTPPAAPIVCVDRVNFLWSYNGTEHVECHRDAIMDIQRTAHDRALVVCRCRRSP